MSTLLSPAFFSICIPQYNRTSFLLEACRSLAVQTFREFEVCISDDCSTDGREQELIAYLEGSGLRFTYRRQVRNTRYDGNLRASIALATGQYCLLLGNDDSLATRETLADLARALRTHPEAVVALTNYAEHGGGRRYERVTADGIIGRGPSTAARVFRNFSFVSGVILARAQAQALATERWDGSEMYQMYLGCRMLADGGTLLGITQFAIRKDIPIPGEQVESYASQVRHEDLRVIERRLPLASLGRVVVDAVTYRLGAGKRDQLTVRIFLQILLFTYPYWIIEYRRVHSWQYAFGICLGMRPRYLLYNVMLYWPWRVALICIYLTVTLAGMLISPALFRLLQTRLYRLAKML